MGGLRINEEKSEYVREQRSVLTPLNGVQIVSLLNQFPEGTQLAQEIHTVLDRLENVVDLGIGGETTNSEADTAMGALVATSQGTQDVTWFQRSRGAGTTRGQSNVFQGHQKRLTLDVGERDVHATRVVSLGVTIKGRVLHAEKTVAKTL